MKSQRFSSLNSNLRSIYLKPPPSYRPAAAYRHIVSAAAPPIVKPAPPSNNPKSSPLAILPLSDILRSYGITTISSSPLLLKIGIGLLRSSVTSQWAIFNAERNPLLKWIITKTFYDQFCAGATEKEVGASINKLRQIGYQGVILEYGAEVLEEEVGDRSNQAEKTAKGIQEWKDGLLDTMKMLRPGDYMGLKWSGMGSEALKLMKHNEEPQPQMWDAMKELCDAATERQITLLPSAEPQNANRMVDRWTTELAQIYNSKTPGHAVLYHTFQCYLKSAPGNIRDHLAIAKEQGFTLGVKLVRGAYLETETRNLIWDTKEQTDEVYDGILEELLDKRYGKTLGSPATQEVDFPDINIVVASHNQASVQKANAIQEAQAQRGEKQVKTAYATLQGMADEVSCEILVQRRLAEQSGRGGVQAPILKSPAWGTFSQCTHYLLRRAEENKDAVSRTLDTRKAMGKELRRRFWKMFGWT